MCTGEHERACSAQASAFAEAPADRRSLGGGWSACAIPRRVRVGRAFTARLPFDLAQGTPSVSRGVARVADVPI